MSNDAIHGRTFGDIIRNFLNFGGNSFFGGINSSEEFPNMPLLQRVEIIHISL